ncbi:MAG: hypothetical protein GWP59_03220 [Chlamydiales bacterium]|nr:hypothetical protein [Chlamydiales bacterium]NCF70696.1 hypothetical protein [Chlamydiales bacterium]
MSNLLLVDKMEAMGVTGISANTLQNYEKALVSPKGLTAKVKVYISGHPAIVTAKKLHVSNDKFDRGSFSASIKVPSWNVTAATIAEAKRIWKSAALSTGFKKNSVRTKDLPSGETKITLAMSMDTRRKA